eukprot:TRINITY_DN9092_c0_g1_i1.p2 TRINITY_DN9092_c0_g1~~TRINITY_DN9092_c0_g1_i1.p2  ORF type:complete len:209 (-),score=-26.25 TRINITY_DN9092_c0_g1_i1:411-1037(-)
MYFVNKWFDNFHPHLAIFITNISSMYPPEMYHNLFLQITTHVQHNTTENQKNQNYTSYSHYNDIFTSFLNPYQLTRQKSFTTVNLMLRQVNKYITAITTYQICKKHSTFPNLKNLWQQHFCNLFNNNYSHHFIVLNNIHPFYFLFMFCFDVMQVCFQTLYFKGILVKKIQFQICHQNKKVCGNSAHKFNLNLQTNILSTLKKKQLISS